MTLIFLDKNAQPTYIALSTDIADNKITGATIKGGTVFLADTGDWKIIGSDRVLVDYYPGGVPLESNKAVPVNIQDQHSEIIDLNFSRTIQEFILTNNTSIDDTTIIITSDAEPSNGSTLCLKEETAFYQGQILSHVSSGADWSCVLDTPLDFAFTDSGSFTERSENLAVDGSGTPVEFVVSPNNLGDDVEWDIVRLLFNITDQTAMDDATFGGISGLTRGIVVRVKNGITKNIFNAKSNGEFANHCYDVGYSDKAPAGFFGFNARRTFGGQSRNGVTIRLRAIEADSLVVLIQDDLRNLDTFSVVAQGHIVVD